MPNYVTGSGIDFIYTFNQYTSQIIDQNVADTTGTNPGGGLSLQYYPGKFAGESAPDTFIVYKVLPYTDREFFMVHWDKLEYKVYSVNYDTLHRVMDTLLINLNINILFEQANLDAAPLPTFLASGYRLMGCFVRIIDEDEDIYIEGNNYWMGMIQFNLIYTYIATTISNSQAAYIGA